MRSPRSIAAISTPQARVPARATRAISIDAQAWGVLASCALLGEELAEALDCCDSATTRSKWGCRCCPRLGHALVPAWDGHRGSAYYAAGSLGPGVGSMLG
jgi:hypothetical protein